MRKRRTREEVAKAKATSDKRHAAHILATYGLTVEEYEALKAFQDGVCFICQRANGSTRRLAVDHDHVTGRVRGLLCKPCNRMLGHARDDREFFVRAASYLYLPPASLIGLGRVVPGHVVRSVPNGEQAA